MHIHTNFKFRLNTKKVIENSTIIMIYNTQRVIDTFTSLSLSKLIDWIINYHSHFDLCKYSHAKTIIFNFTFSII